MLLVIQMFSGDLPGENLLPDFYLVTTFFSPYGLYNFLKNILNVRLISVAYTLTLKEVIPSETEQVTFQTCL